jgi:hypothetical protein
MWCGDSAEFGAGKMFFRRILGGRLARYSLLVSLVFSFQTNRRRKPQAVCLKEPGGTNLDLANRYSAGIIYMSLLAASYQKWNLTTAAFLQSSTKR